MRAVSRITLAAAVALILTISVSAQITIAPENRCSPYDRSDYSYPQSIELQIIAENLDGKIISPYTGEVFSSRSQTDIEHIVATSEAHDSGLCAATAATRRGYARDLDNLTLASPSLNRYQKSGKDLAEWTPAQNVCWFAQTVVTVKAKYSLSMDDSEASAASAILQRCFPREQCQALGLAGLLNCYAGIAPCCFPREQCQALGLAGLLNCYAGIAPSGPTQEQTESAPQQAELSAQPSPTQQPTVQAPAPVNALALYDDNGNGRITCAEARGHGIAPVRRGHPAYPYMNDRDNDGIVCE